jgi:hypothetical protein
MLVVVSVSGYVRVIVYAVIVSWACIICILLFLQFQSFKQIKELHKISISQAFEIQQLKELPLLAQAIEIEQLKKFYNNNPIEINYGILNNYINVKDICISKLLNNIITIPSGDGNRANIFGDPLPGTLKSIFIVNNNNTTEYKDDVNIKINIINNNIIVNTN